MNLYNLNESFERQFNINIDESLDVDSLNEGALDKARQAVINAKSKHLSAQAYRADKAGDKAKARGDINKMNQYRLKASDLMRKSDYVAADGDTDKITQAAKDYGKNLKLSAKEYASDAKPFLDSAKSAFRACKDINTLEKTYEMFYNEMIKISPKIQRDDYLYKQLRKLYQDRIDKINADEEDKRVKALKKKEDKEKEADDALRAQKKFDYEQDIEDAIQYAKDKGDAELEKKLQAVSDKKSANKQELIDTANADAEATINRVQDAEEQRLQGKAYKKANTDIERDKVSSYAALIKNLMLQSQNFTKPLFTITVFSQSSADIVKQLIAEEGYDAQTSVASGPKGSQYILTCVKQ